MNLKIGSIAILLMVLLACNAEKVEKPYNKGISVTPRPTSIVKGEGVFTLNRKTVFVAESEQISEVITLFAKKLKTSTGYEMDVVNTNPRDNFINVVIETQQLANDEAYKLKVTSKNIEITGSTIKGIFYGLQTLLQLLPAEVESSTLVTDVDWNIPIVDIQDEPRFKYRGLHLDVCRHYVPVEDIKKHLDMMAMFKMNKFHWHLTEDQGWRIEIEKYPLLTQIGSKRIEGEGNEYGGFYTQQEVKEIVAYASDRMIDVIPEIELPGHALAALTAYPEYSCTGGPFKVRNIWGVEPDVYCAGKEETFEFLEDIIDEVVALFPSEYFHIGGDECPKTRWESCMLCQRRMKEEGLKDEHELQSYFVQRIEKVLLAHGKKMIGWDEILEGGLAESAAVMSWRGEDGGIEAATHGHDVVMTPGNWCYLDHFQGDSRVEPVAIGGYTTLEESYSYEPVPEQLKAEMAKHVLGTQGNVWTEYMYTPELIEYRVYPRIIALAEVNWTSKENKNFTDFARRMDNQYVRMDMHDINYHIPLPEGPCNKVVFTNSAKVEFTTTRPVKMVYTLDGSEPTAESAVYEQPFNLSENTEIKIASVLSSGKMSKVRTIVVEKQPFKPAVDVGTKRKGLKEKYTKGDFIYVADLEKVKDWTETASDVNLPPAYTNAQIDEPSAHILSGYIEMPEDGIYEFSTNVDQFFLGGQLLINNDGEVKRFSRNNTTVALKKGKHEVKLIYLNNIIGGWPQAWNGPRIDFRLQGTDEFTKVSQEMYSF
ncbi:family 20 glycosylhydrolase [Draconibacterium sediminis]|uniref:beta-N-acetylhexosaminidase n=1 Tax=Draconibacterium sediminis TaxID=1544798 RepID=A0A0D8JFP9_9BACT|nr:family 20 glycosylhydrolase [Draconibacterium sediminis]KJF45381.1 beta-hexosaminidase [Draconibacterium sediminis]